MESDKRYSLVKIEGVDDSKAASFYLGKKVAFVYRAKREVRGSNIRVIWGKVTRPHGTSTKSWTDCKQKF
jgi:large subunit ribosomal protein L35Ae